MNINEGDILKKFSDEVDSAVKKIVNDMAVLEKNGFSVSSLPTGRQACLCGEKPILDKSDGFSIALLSRTKRTTGSARVGELVLWYGMFAPCGRFLGTTGFARGAP